MDLSNIDTCKSAADSMPKVDVLIMNAGQTSAAAYKSTNSQGVTPAFYEMCIGHGTFLEAAIKGGKITPGSRVIYAGGELQRSVLLFTGFQPYPESYKSWKRNVKEFPAKPPVSWMPVRTMIAGMQNYKTYMCLYMNKLSREHPDIYFAEVSPGGTATGFYNDFPQPLKFLVQNAAPVFRLVGGMHSVEKAAARYVAAATDPEFEKKFKSGSFVASPWSFPRYIGASGPLTDNTPWCPELSDTELQDEATAFIRGVTAGSV